MGIIPCGESPWGWAPTIRYGMATDAINISETCYLTAVLYYIANLGMTMESQVRSSGRTLICHTFCLSVAIYSLLTSLSSPCASLCAVPPLSHTLYDPVQNRHDLVAARLSRTRTLAVTIGVHLFELYLHQISTNLD